MERSTLKRYFCWVSRGIVDGGSIKILLECAKKAWRSLRQLKKTEMEVVREFDEACLDKAHSLESNNV